MMGPEGYASSPPGCHITSGTQGVSQWPRAGVMARWGAWGLGAWRGCLMGTGEWGELAVGGREGGGPWAEGSVAPQRRKWGSYI